MPKGLALGNRPRPAGVVLEDGRAFLEQLSPFRDLQSHTQTVCQAGLTVRASDLYCRGSSELGPGILARALKKARGEPVRVVIASEGGVGQAALQCVDILTSYRGAITTEVLWAGSAASLVAMAGSRRVMHSDSWHLVHAIWGIGLGSPAQVAEAARQFAAAEQACVEIYSRSGLPESEITRLMETEAALSADEALRLRLVDSILPEPCGAPPVPRAKHPSLEKLALAANESTGRTQGLLANFWGRAKALIDAGHSMPTHMFGLRWKCDACGTISCTNPERPCPQCGGNS